MIVMVRKKTTSLRYSSSKKVRYLCFSKNESLRMFPNLKLFKLLIFLLKQAGLCWSICLIFTK